MRGAGCGVRGVTCTPLIFCVEKTVSVTIMCERDDCSFRLVTPTERLALPRCTAACACPASVIGSLVMPRHIMPITSS